MGFFKDFKRDFAQAVNELIPDKDEMAGEYDDEDMVNTFDENDNMEIAPEDLLEDIDDYGDNGLDIEQQVVNYAGSDVSEEEAVGEESDDTEDVLSDVPEAELISEHDFNTLDEINVSDDDELNSLDALDEDNMMEGLEDAQLVEGEDEGEESEEGYYGNPFEQINEPKTELHDMDLQKDIEDAIQREELPESEEEPEDIVEQKYDTEDTDELSGGFPEADKFREDVMAEVELNSHTNDKANDIEDVFEVDTTYITKGTIINGDVSTEGSIDVLGTVNGNVTCKGKLIIGGTVKGNINAGEIYANAAKVEGVVVAEGSVKIGVGSIVVGDISAASAMIAGAVNGDIDVHGPVIVDSTAVIMGNIKSRSVQINNGAVIEGFCSQCYSEIDVKSFFDMDDSTDDGTVEEAEETVGKVDEAIEEADETADEPDEASENEEDKDE